MEVKEPERVPSRRGRKPTGRKTFTIGMSIPQWLHDRLKKDAKAKEDELCTVQNVIRRILLDYYQEKDQPTLFENKGRN